MGHSITKDDYLKEYLFSTYNNYPNNNTFAEESANNNEELEENFLLTAEEDISQEDCNKYLDNFFTKEAKTDMVLASDEGEELFIDGSFLSKEFRRETKEVARDIVSYLCREDKDLVYPSPSKSCTIMRNLVNDLLSTRVDLMTEMVFKLKIENERQLKNLDAIATQMFEDEVVTWSRIVTFHAFCGYLADYCHNRDLMDGRAEELIGDTLADIVVNRLGLWIVANGGWNSFENQFPVICMYDLGAFWKFLVSVLILASVVFLFYLFVKKLDRSNNS